ncbi:NAD(P)-dependent oxidoreductase [Thalassobaculum sp. OXR-137]|uniref:NAD(P)-dependent oxidoreductase n=1 Tax=Thalassobaculum sp. OXR-137 TaxID=3100173 RepID=UPI002AC96A94|nr:NAD(P)-dependent oxidoreductase [Thalassobaculum sp. OXR-137]WPZ32141.1 NAD(P)-dependent oxidoreductase [Thalassobaculum sp. OXR-137]
MRIAFLGLGLMGEGFTRRLVALGHDVTGFDPVAERRLASAAWGVAPAETPAAAAEGAELVMTCVTTTDDLERALFAKDGAAGAMSEGAILVDFSTTVVARTKAMAERLKRERGAGWLDAPVSGGPPAAQAGKLAIMMGGDDADAARAEPVLSGLAASLVHLGPVGAGQVTKMVNQVCVLTNFVVLAEALNLAERGGVDTSRLQAALETGYAGSNLMAAMWPRMMARDYAPAGYLRQVLKDLDMVHDLAHDLQAAIPMSTQAAELFRLMAARGHEQEDGIAVLKLFTGEPV